MKSRRRNRLSETTSLEGSWLISCHHCQLISSFLEVHLESLICLRLSESPSWLRSSTRWTQMMRPSLSWDFWRSSFSSWLSCILLLTFGIRLWSRGTYGYLLLTGFMQVSTRRSTECTTNLSHTFIWYIYTLQCWCLVVTKSDLVLTWNLCLAPLFWSSLLFSMLLFSVSLLFFQRFHKESRTSFKIKLMLPILSWNNSRFLKSCKSKFKNSLCILKAQNTNKNNKSRSSAWSLQVLHPEFRSWSSAPASKSPPCLERYSKTNKNWCPNKWNSKAPTQSTFKKSSVSWLKDSKLNLLNQRMWSARSSMIPTRSIWCQREHVRHTSRMRRRSSEREISCIRVSSLVKSH